MITYVKGIALPIYNFPSPNLLKTIKKNPVQMKELTLGGNNRVAIVINFLECPLISMSFIYQPKTKGIYLAINIATPLLLDCPGELCGSCPHVVLKYFSCPVCQKHIKREPLKAIKNIA